MNNVNQGWLYGSVKTYFLKKGINLLRDDMLFIEKCLSNIPSDRHKLVMRDYLAIWSTTVKQKELSDSTKLNPRYEANVFLRSAAILKNKN